MRLTPLALLVSLLAVSRVGASDIGSQIKVLAQVVEFRTETVEARAKAQLGTPLTASDIQEMMLDGYGRLVHSLQGVVMGGTTAVVQATKECRFPDEFTIHRRSAKVDEKTGGEKVRIAPCDFDSKPIGPTLDFTCRLDRGRSRVEMELMYRCLSEPHWQKHEVEYLLDGREPVAVSYERPTFHKQEVQTKLFMGFGTTRVIGSGMPDRTGDKTALLLLTCYLVDEHGSLLRDCGFGLGRTRRDWSYDGTFGRLVNEADRIVVRDGGYDCCIPTDGQESLVVIQGMKAVREFNKHLEFIEKQEPGFCFCCGYPGIDWYKGDRRLALTSVMHGTAIRWRGFPGDVALTEESRRWLVLWLLDHGIAGQDGEYEKMRQEWQEKANE